MPVTLCTNKKLVKKYARWRIFTFLLYISLKAQVITVTINLIIFSWDRMTYMRWWQHTPAPASRTAGPAPQWGTPRGCRRTTQQQPQKQQPARGQYDLGSAPRPPRPARCPGVDQETWGTRSSPSARRWSHGVWTDPPWWGRSGSKPRPGTHTHTHTHTHQCVLRAKPAKYCCPSKHGELIQQHGYPTKWI